jgi:hypothetical protein
MNAATLDDLRWLTSPDAAARLQRADKLRDSPLDCAAQLRRELSAERAALVQEQAQLRRRAARKFSAAERMFLTARGLEQATDEAIATHKAARFAASSPVADLCCGIGGDLLAIAARGSVIGVDRDATAAHFAAANVEAVVGVCNGVRGRVLCGDVGEFDVTQVSAWHIDPDRRPDGRRTTRVALHEPSDAVIDALRRINGNAAIKLAPAAELPPHWQSEAELEWIGHARQCQQLVAWFGDLAKRPGERRATSLEGDNAASFFGSPDAQADVAGRIGRFVYEPHAAVLAAGLWGDLAVRRGLACVAPRIPYLTADAGIDDPMLAPFEVLDILPLQVKRLKAALRARGVGTLEIKKRGVPVEPETLRRQLAPGGDESLTLIAMPHGGKSIAVLARRIAPP